MTKRYISGTILSINLATGGSNYRHISFDPDLRSGSSYVSEDPEEQELLEAHPYFGDRFVLDPAWVDQSGEGVKSEETDQADEETAEEATGEEATGEETLTFTNESDAKEYLAETFGISRTKLKSRKSIESVAAEQGVVITWEDGSTSEDE